MPTFYYQNRHFGALVQRKIRGWKTRHVKTILEARKTDQELEKNYPFSFDPASKEKWTKLDAELTAVLERIKAHPNGQDFLNATIGDLIMGYGERVSAISNAGAFKELIPFSNGIKIILEQLWRDWFNGKRRK